MGSHSFIILKIFWLDLYLFLCYNFTMNQLLEIKNLRARVGDKYILDGVNLSMQKGEVHVIMGPNGSGKSTLANILMGNSKPSLDDGKIFFEGEDITHLSPEERAWLGIFLAFQHPREISGVELSNFLFAAYKNLHKTDSNISVFDFKKILETEAKKLKMNQDLLKRNINLGFSGGEKKKSEMLQLAVLNPKLAILDETDSGLDIDALRFVGTAAKQFQGPEKGILIVTHYRRILEYVKPDHIHIMIEGKIVKSGGLELAKRLEREGYDQFKSKIIKT